MAFEGGNRHVDATLAVRNVMTPWPYSIDLDAPLSDARQLMRKYEIRHLPVTRDDAVVGIVTDRDIKLILGPDFDYPAIRELRVRDIYAEPYVVNEDTPLNEVLREMVRRHIGSAIVTESGRLSGIFTAFDACRALADTLSETGRRAHDAASA